MNYLESTQLGTLDSSVTKSLMRIKLPFQFSLPYGHPMKPNSPRGKLSTITFINGQQITLSNRKNTVQILGKSVLKSIKTPIAPPLSYLTRTISCS